MGDDESENEKLEPNLSCPDLRENQKEYNSKTGIVPSIDLKEVRRNNARGIYNEKTDWFPWPIINPDLPETWKRAYCDAILCSRGKIKIFWINLSEILGKEKPLP